VRKHAGDPKTHVERSNTVKDPAVSPAHPHGASMGTIRVSAESGIASQVYQTWNATRAGENIKYIIASESSSPSRGMKRCDNGWLRGAVLRVGEQSFAVRTSHSLMLPSGWCARIPILVVGRQSMAFLFVLRTGKAHRCLAPADPLSRRPEPVAPKPRDSRSGCMKCWAILRLAWPTAAGTGVIRE
jgi:hypothetical protein